MGMEFLFSSCSNVEYHHFVHTDVLALALAIGYGRDPVQKKTKKGSGSVMAFPRSCGPGLLIHHSTPSAACNSIQLHPNHTHTPRCITSSSLLHTAVAACTDNEAPLALTLV